MFLPPRHLVCQKFLLDICTGKKKAILLIDVVRYNLKASRYLTKKNLAKVIKESEELRDYFPNKLLKRTDMQFCVDVINTLDPDFFPNCEQEIKQVEMKEKKKERRTIELTPQIHNLLH